MDQLVLAVVDFMMPTFGSISTAIAFWIQRLILEPKVLVKVQAECDEVVGRGRLPGLNDRIR